MKKLLDFFTANWKFLVIACLLAVASFEIIQLRHDLNGIAGKLGPLASNVTSIRSDIGSIQENINTIQDDVGAIADAIEGIQSDAGRHATNRVATPLQKKERKAEGVWL